MGKDKKGVNPAEAFRKEEKKKAIKKAQQQKKQVQEVRSLLNDPTKIDEEIAKYQKLSNEIKLDKSLKDKVEELKQMKTIALRKQQIEVIQGKRPKTDSPPEEGKIDAVSSSTVPVIPQSSARGYPIQRRPEESIYYHPSLNPTGAPPPGAPMIYRPNPLIPPPPPSAIGPFGGGHAAPPRPVYGVPPPPGYGRPVPAYGMAAPIGWNRNGGGNPAPNPTRPNVAIGGMNGIPLPPPRPVGGLPVNVVASAANPHLIAAQQRKENKRKRNVTDEFVDPLDPAADGYTERFQKKLTAQFPNKSQKLEKTSEASPVTLPSIPIQQPALNSMPSAPTVSQSTPHNIEEENREHAAEQEESEVVESSYPSNNPKAAVDFSVFANFVVNREEILKRRLQTINSDDAKVTKPFEDDSNQEETELEVGPSRPPPMFVVEDVDEDEDSDGDDEVADEEEEGMVVGPSRPTDLSMYEDYYSTPRISGSYVPSNEGSAPRLFTAAEIEGDDSNEEEENTRTINMVNGIGSSTAASNKAVAAVLPGFEYYDSDEGSGNDDDDGVDGVTIEDQASKIEISSIRSLPQSTVSVNPSNSAVASVSSHNIIQETQLPNERQLPTKEIQPKLLTVVKADSALTSLIPNVLKKKKKAAELQPNCLVSAPSAIVVPQPGPISVPATEPAPQQPISHVSSTLEEKKDDLLNDFFSELEGLEE